MSKITLWFNFKAREQPSKYPTIPHKAMKVYLFYVLSDNLGIKAGLEPNAL